ncbi:sigma 54-interacting transcriptional regulator [Pendulispora albinea]|uniref:Sigma 54-interacting transcriptional regulator n=1 Tax=Pendulispora albinea TaxID=2741071 RepID=A0ABZ2LZQ1_9BACT
MHLMIARGTPLGARIVVDHTVKIVGRAYDTDLTLEDRAVSRHHFQVVATSNHEVRVRVCGTAAPLIHADRTVRDAVLKTGDSFVVGNTVLVVAEGEAAADGDACAGPLPSSPTITAIQNLLGGPASDVRAFAAIVALNEALAAARDIPSLTTALGVWAKEHIPCDHVDVALVPPIAEVDDTTAIVETVSETDRAKRCARLVVPARGSSGSSICWLGFTTTIPPQSVTDPLRRLLVIVGQICATRMAQMGAQSELLAVQEDRESLRRQALGSAHAFLGSSAPAKDVVRFIPKLAVSDTRVLLKGESGVGKTFVARLLHELGPRTSKPFQVVNCAAIPEHSIESALFGHERGAFTGAVATQRGVFEAAEGGTVLLDEIGELPLASQAKLLRALEDKRYERLGSTQSRVVSARVIATTNRDLDAMVAAGTFRVDLFFRISVVSLRIPSLRERAGDLELLARRILEDLLPSAGRRIDGFSPEALDSIRRYSWPGNVRELRNAIEHAIALGEGRLIASSDLPATVRSAPKAPSEPAAAEHPSLIELPMNENQLHARNREAALRRSDGNITRAAALLGIERAALYKTTIYKKRSSN